MFGIYSVMYFLALPQKVPIEDLECTKKDIQGLKPRVGEDGKEEKANGHPSEASSLGFRSKLTSTSIFVTRAISNSRHPPPFTSTVIP